MSTAAEKAEIAERNRRESFRMNDRVGLRAHEIGESEFLEMKSASSDRVERHRILNSIIAGRDAQRSALRSIRDEDPTVAAYLQTLEDRLEAMARLLTLGDESVAGRPTHEVNISGTGILFQHERAVPKNGRLHLELQLFPSRTCLDLFAVVVRCTELPEPPPQGGRFMVAADFSSIHEDDQELLIRHVHGLQMEQVRRGALRA